MKDDEKVGTSTKLAMVVAGILVAFALIPTRRLSDSPGIPESRAA
jgi:hypothetical protein